MCNFKFIAITQTKWRRFEKFTLKRKKIRKKKTQCFRSLKKYENNRQGHVLFILQKLIQLSAFTFLVNSAPYRKMSFFSKFTQKTSNFTHMKGVVKRKTYANFKVISLPVPVLQWFKVEKQPIFHNNLNIYIKMLHKWNFYRDLTSIWPPQGPCLLWGQRSRTGRKIPKNSK